MAAKSRTNQVPIRFSDEELDRIRNMLHWTGRSFQSLFHLTIMREVERIEKDEHKGKPFPQRPAD